MRCTQLQIAKQKAGAEKADREASAILESNKPQDVLTTPISQHGICILHSPLTSDSKSYKKKFIEQAVHNLFFILRQQVLLIPHLPVIFCFSSSMRSYVRTHVPSSAVCSSSASNLLRASYVLLLFLSPSPPEMTLRSHHSLANMLANKLFHRHICERCMYSLATLWSGQDKGMNKEMLGKSQMWDEEEEHDKVRAYQPVCVALEHIPDDEEDAWAPSWGPHPHRRLIATPANLVEKILKTQPSWWERLA